MSERHELDNKQRGESMVRKGLMKSHAYIKPIRLVPDLQVTKIGGHGAMDYGSEVVVPLVEEIGEVSKNHKLLIVSGGGVRERPTRAIGIDLGMPTGVRAQLAGKISEQNAEMLALLLFPRGGNRTNGEVYEYGSIMV